MNIKTEYKIGDLVWVMRKNRPVRLEIFRIKVSETYQKSHVSVKYCLNIINGNRDGAFPDFEFDKHYKVDQSRMFNTKEELIQSL
jgi:hypothetical protein